MKKFLSVILAVLMIGVTFTGCGISEPDANYAPVNSSIGTDISGFATEEIYSAFEQAISENDKNYLSEYWMPYCVEILDNAYSKSEDESLLYDCHCYADSIPQLENVSSCYQEESIGFSYGSEECQSIIDDVMDIYSSYYPDFEIESVTVSTFRVEGDSYETSVDLYLVKIASGYLLLAMDGGLDGESSSYTVPNLNVRINNDGYVDETVGDGAIHLFSYSVSADFFNPCYDYVNDMEDSMPKSVVCWKNANELIPKIDKNALVGITEALDEVSFLPISAPTYAVPLNFANNITREKNDVYEYPEFINVKSDIDGNELTEHLKHSTECNEQELKKFVNENSTFFVYRGGTMGGPLWECYKLLIGEKNQEFTFSGYIGTSWEERTATACLEYYRVPENKNGHTFNTVKTEKTKNGYFKVDLSGMDSGIYYVSSFNTFVELV